NLEMEQIAASDFADLTFLHHASADRNRSAIAVDKPAQLGIAREDRAAVRVVVLDDDIATAMAGVGPIDKSQFVLFDLDHHARFSGRNRRPRRRRIIGAWVEIWRSAHTSAGTASQEFIDQQF